MLYDFAHLLVILCICLYTFLFVYFNILPSIFQWKKDAVSVDIARIDIALRSFSRISNVTERSHSNFDEFGDN